MTVLYEDPHIIVCQKPVGVQSENGTATLPGMPEHLRAFWGDATAPVFPVHRLDAAVSGVMVYAKTKQAAAALSAQMQDKRFQKEYRAAVCTNSTQSAQTGSTPTTTPHLNGNGTIRTTATAQANANARASHTAPCAPSLAPCATLEDILYHDKRKGKVFPVKKERKGAKHAILHYEMIAQGLLPSAPPSPAASASSSPNADVPISLVRVQLETGRTHQIRVQFASRKHPLLGDGKYGSRIKLPSLALFSAKLSFEHPKTHKRLTFSAPLPDTAPWIFFDT